jgi:uncharacterized secreted protein with C-terminal beta-propeller domain
VAYFSVECRMTRNTVGNTQPNFSLKKGMKKGIFRDMQINSCHQHVSIVDCTPRLLPKALRGVLHVVLKFARTAILSVCVVILALGQAMILRAQSPEGTPNPVVVTQSLLVRATPASVDVEIPAGFVRGVVEARLRGRKTWMRWRSFSVKAGASRFSFIPPRGFGKTGFLVEEFRASGVVDLALAEKSVIRRKYPASFYRGLRNFTASPAAGYKSGLNGATGSSNAAGDLRVMAMNTTRAKPVEDSSTLSTGNSASKAQAVEADIWKTDGSTVYFFNQLRGLQVVDLTDPSKPMLQARLRLPAVGQDLYLLPEQVPGERLVVLLTRSYEDVSGSQIEVVVVRVAGSKADVVARQTLAGSLQDSRMVGSHLYVVGTDWAKFWQNYGRPVPVKIGADGVEVQEEPQTNTNLYEVVVGSDGGLKLAASLPVPGFSSSAFISAGGDWLAITSSDWTNWRSSQITLYGLSESGAALLTPTPLQTKGRVYDKFKISYQKDTLMAVTQRWEPADKWSEQVVTLECFDALGNALTQVEIKRGENLFATRFAGDKLYVVTAVVHDPLWVMDISDPRAPVMGGHVEVPGFSTYIEPVGDEGRFLFTIGLENGKVVASLFDVSDPANPFLTPDGRVQVSEGWGYSEAVWDEKALKVLSEDGLALIPFSAGWGSGSNAFVRLVEMDLSNEGSLKLRGRLEHDFVPRRATMTNGVLTSISQKELITANVADRDNPAILAEVALAWPVNQILQTGEFLLQIADGSNAYWSKECASIAVSKVQSEDSIEQITELGAGIVSDAVIRDNKLFVLRRIGAGSPGFWLRPMVIARSGTGDSSQTPQPVVAEGLVLDVFDISKLPALSLIGSTAVPVSAEDLGSVLTSLLWINDKTPAVLTQAQAWFWGGWYDYYPPIAVEPAVGARMMISPAVISRRRYQPKPAVIRAFDVSDPASPVAFKPLQLAAVSETLVSVSAAGDGLLVYAYGEKPNPYRVSGFSREGEDPVSAVHRLGVVDYLKPDAPVVRAPIQVPGRVFAVTDLARDGFLVYSETISTVTTSAKPTREVQVSVIDGTQAVLVARTPVGALAVLAAEGRSLYIAENNRVQRLAVQDSAAFQEIASTAVDWTPTDLQTRGLTLLGVSGNNLMRVSWAGLSPAVETWKMRRWFGLTKMTIGVDRTIFAPMGEFGVERFEAK